MGRPSSESDRCRQRAALRRRAFLGATGLAIAGGFAGCVGMGPMPRTSLSVEVRDSFDAASPVAVPLSIDVFVQNVDDKRVSLRGVELVALDGNRVEIETRSLGRFARQEAPPANRSTEEYDNGMFGSSTAYRAEWTLDKTVELDQPPAWLSFRVDGLRFGDEDDQQSGLSPLLIGRARASQPPADLSVRIAHRLPGRADRARLGPDDYRREHVDVYGSVEPSEIYLPEPEPETTEAETTVDRKTRKRKRTAADGSEQETTTNQTATRTASERQSTAARSTTTDADR